MDFRDRLHRAAERGRQARDAKTRADAERALTEEEMRRLHSDARDALLEQIERCLKQLADAVPGFQYESVLSERGWGGAVRRDDLVLSGGKRDSLFSRLELTVSPFNQYHVVDLSARGAVRNKENFTRQHYQKLKEADFDAFLQLVEQWTLDYAEQYAAGT